MVGVERGWGGEQRAEGGEEMGWSRGRRAERVELRRGEERRGGDRGKDEGGRQTGRQGGSADHPINNEQQGRKLRTEFKKVLKEGEKERIERDKAIKRMRSVRELTSNLHGESLGPPVGWNRREASAPGGYAMGWSNSAPLGGGGVEEEDYGRLVQGAYSSAFGVGAGGAGGGQTRSFGQREYVPAPLTAGESVYSQAQSNGAGGAGGGGGYGTSPPSDVGTSISARMAQSSSGGSGGSEASEGGGAGESNEGW